MKYSIILMLIVLLAGSNLHGHDWLGKDKIAHFSSSIVLTCWSVGMSEDILGENKSNSRIMGSGFTLSLGLVKEGYDRYIQHKKWSWEDLVWDMAGIAGGLILINNQMIE
ncbi:MAG: hypothetical protein P9X26_06170 [Candidatus Stygibacter frigidus]|nr:hypothetical protein [Candidatus Stygibacter frigidus]